MKNYYDELEVSKNASKDVIEKVYKVLAKKYHPDTTQETNKQVAEEKFKIISEAYETLSNEEKRKQYDLKLEQSNPTITYEQYIRIVNERDTLNNALNNLKNEFYQFKNSHTTSQTYSNNHQMQYNNSQYQQSQFNQNYTNQNVVNKKKKYYYNTVTGQPVSYFEYLKYKIRKFFSNIGFYLLVIFALLLILNSFLPFDIFSLFIK